MTEGNGDNVNEQEEPVASDTATTAESPIPEATPAPPPPPPADTSPPAAEVAAPSAAQVESRQERLAYAILFYRVAANILSHFPPFGECVVLGAYELRPRSLRAPRRKARASPH